MTFLPLRPGVASLVRADRRTALGVAGLAALAATVVAVWLGFGVLSLPGLVVLAVVAVLAGTWLVTRFPQALVVLGPTLFPLPFMMRALWPLELATFAFAGLIAIQGALRRAAWLTRLEGIEQANFAYIGWALFTGFWCQDPSLYVTGVRRLLLGAAGLWIGLRLRHVVSRRSFELGLTGCAATLAISALVVRSSTGLSEKSLLLHRGMATDLGYGAANFIATLLLILTPLLLVMARRAQSPLRRTVTWVVLIMIALVQVLIASRAASVLYVLGVLAFFGRSVSRRRWLYVAVAAALLGGLLASPLSAGLLARFTSLRDMGSIVVRIWYWREAWRRTIIGFPWGIGLGQGRGFPDHLQTIDPHDYWLYVSSELGVIGVVAWLVVLVVLWRRIQRSPPDDVGRERSHALHVAFWLSQLHTLVEPTFQGPQYQLLHFWVFGGWLGYAFATRPLASRAPAPSAGSISRR